MSLCRARLYLEGCDFEAWRDLAASEAAPGEAARELSPVLALIGSDEATGFTMPETIDAYVCVGPIPLPLPRSMRADVDIHGSGAVLPHFWQHSSLHCHPPHVHSIRYYLHTVYTPLPSQRPRSSRSRTLRSFGFFLVWPGLVPPSWPLDPLLVLPFFLPSQPSVCEVFRSLRFSV